jgi:hypothetical protein
MSFTTGNKSNSNFQASVLQHPLGPLAPASVSATATPSEGLLGAVPHTIRGSLNNFQQVLNVDVVQKPYPKGKNLGRVFNSRYAFL